jgi:hypothetical protein
MNAQGASLQDETLTLNGVAPSSIVFADRPVRAAGHMLTTHLLAGWSGGSEGFPKNPPNAIVSVFSKDDATVHDAVVVLKTPKLVGDRLTFAVQVLEGNLAGADGLAPDELHSGDVRCAWYCAMTQRITGRALQRLTSAARASCLNISWWTGTSFGPANSASRLATVRSTLLKRAPAR